MRIKNEDFRNLLQRDMFDQIPDMFSEDQLEVIEQAWKNKIDLKKHITPKYSIPQMTEIYLGLKDKVDISKYNNINLDYSVMEQIRLALKKKIDLTKYIDVTQVNKPQLFQVRLALEHGVDPRLVRKYMSDPQLDMWKLQDIRRQLEGK